MRTPEQIEAAITALLKVRKTVMPDDRERMMDEADAMWDAPECANCQDTGRVSTDVPSRAGPLVNFCPKMCAAAKREMEASSQGLRTSHQLMKANDLHKRTGHVDDSCNHGREHAEKSQCAIFSCEPVAAAVEAPQTERDVTLARSRELARTLEHEKARREMEGTVNEKGPAPIAPDDRGGAKCPHCGKQANDPAAAQGCVST